MLLFLLAAAPAVTLTWFIVETIASISLAKRHHTAISVLLPAIALFMFIESLAIDIYVVLHFKL